VISLKLVWTLVYLTGFYHQMPARKVKGGWKWGKTGKVYKTRKEAIQQGIAIRMNKKNRKV